jgi:hypothetical protein
MLLQFEETEHRFQAVYCKTTTKYLHYLSAGVNIHHSLYIFSVLMAEAHYLE